MSYVSPLAIQNALLESFTTFWAARTPIAYPNSNFDPAALLGDDLEAAWVRVYLLGDVEPGQVRYSNSVASDHFSRSMTITFEVYVRQNTSMDQPYTLIDNVLEYLQKPDVPNAIFTNISSPVEIGPDGVWFQVTVSADLLYYTDRPVG